jgi:hypothetical protein
VITVVAGVLVPDTGPYLLSPFRPGPVTNAFLTLLAVTMVVFVGVVLWYTLIGWRTGRRPQWALVLSLVGVSLGAMAVAFVLYTGEERAHEAAVREARARVVAAEEQVRDGLEDQYGVRWPDSEYLPLQDDDYSQAELTLPDGSVAECFVVTERGVYELRCGGTSPEDATPLPEVNR